LAAKGILTLCLATHGWCSLLSGSQLSSFTQGIKAFQRLGLGNCFFLNQFGITVSKVLTGLRVVLILKAPVLFSGRRIRAFGHQVGRPWVNRLCPSTGGLGLAFLKGQAFPWVVLWANFRSLPFCRLLN